MNRKQILLAGLLAVTVVLAGCTGGGGSTTTTGDATTESTATDAPTATATSTSTTAEQTTAADQTATATATPTMTGPEGVAFNASVDNITECGSTCRDVDYTIMNIGQTDATNFSVRMHITSGGDEIYNETVNLATLEANSEESRTERVELSRSGAFTVNSNGGDVTIDITPMSGDVSETFTFERNVG